MTELMQKAIEEIQKLSLNDQNRLAEHILQLINSEVYELDDDDEIDASSYLHHFFDEDGSIKFEEINKNAIPLTLDELYTGNS